MSTSLPPDFVELLRAEQGRVMPFTGAGLSIPAGVSDVPGALVAAAADRGVVIPGGTLLDVTEQLEAAVAEAQTKELVAGVIERADVKPTPTLRALVRCPSRMIATFNYDGAIEMAAEELGLIPRPMLPMTAEAFRTPAPGELMVLHLHGR